MTIQRIDPIQSMIANQLVIYLKNLSHPGSFFFYGNLLSPYSAFLFNAISEVKPVYRFVPNRKHN